MRSSGPARAARAARVLSAACALTTCCILLSAPILASPANTVAAGAPLASLKPFRPATSSSVGAASDNSSSFIVHLLHPRDGDVVANDHPVTVVATVQSNPFEQGASIVCDCRCSAFPSENECDFTMTSVNDAGVVQVDAFTVQTTFRVNDDSVLRCRGHQFVIRVSVAPASPSSFVQATIDVNDSSMSLCYIVTSSMSLVACLALLYLYFSRPEFARYPAIIVLMRVCGDVVWSGALVWLNATEIYSANRNLACNAPVAFLMQFGLLASLSWFFVMALNFYYSVSDPFTRPQSKLPTYHLIVWGSCIVSGIITMGNYGFRSDFQMCWFNNRGGFNVWAVLLYWSWLTVFAALSLVCVFYGWYRLLRHELRSTLDTRLKTLQQMRVYIVASVAYWVVAASLWFRTVHEAETNELIDNPSLSHTFAVWVGLAGFFNVILWLYTQRELVFEMWRDGSKQSTDDQFEDISAALRSEYIANTTEGIIKAVKSVDLFRRRQSQRLSVVATAFGGGGLLAEPKQKAPKPREPLLAQVGGSTGASAKLQRMGTRHRFHTYTNRTEMDLPEERVPLNTLPHEDEQDEEDAVCIPLRNVYIQFYVYAPKTFARLRHIFGVSDASFMKSIAGDARKMKKSFSEGASGSFFYFTVDGTYMVKTLTKDEHKLMLDILPLYEDHMRRCAHSLICRFFGLYSVKMYGSVVYFAVMNNVLQVPREAHYRISEKYDLKGSSVNRHAKYDRNSDKVPTLKDNDLYYQIRMKPEHCRLLVRQLSADSAFLRSCGIMDYSLLVGVGCVEGVYQRFGGTYLDLIQNAEEQPSYVPPIIKSARVTARSDTTMRSKGHASETVPLRIHSPPGSARTSRSPSHARNDSQLSSDADTVEMVAHQAEFARKMGLARGADKNMLLVPRADIRDLSDNNSNYSGGSAAEEKDALSERSPSPSATASGSPSIPTRQRAGSRDDDLLRGRWPDYRHGIGTAEVVVGPGIYHFGVIDILQEWNWSKRLEQWTKFFCMCHCRSWRQVSAVEPVMYSNRFMEMVRRVFPTSEQDHVRRTIVVPHHTPSSSQR